MTELQAAAGHLERTLVDVPMHRLHDVHRRKLWKLRHGRLVAGLKLQGTHLAEQLQQPVAGEADAPGCLE